MAFALLRSLFVAVVLASLSGCGWILGPWGGPAYSLDSDKFNTGQPAFLPWNDAAHVDGESMDHRSGH
jgi:hypothetical protein